MQIQDYKIYEYCACVAGYDVHVPCPCYCWDWRLFKAKVKPCWIFCKFVWYFCTVHFLRVWSLPWRLYDPKGCLKSIISLSCSSPCQADYFYGCLNTVPGAEVQCGWKRAISWPNWKHVEHDTTVTTWKLSTFESPDALVLQWCQGDSIAASALGGAGGSKAGCQSTECGDVLKLDASWCATRLAVTAAFLHANLSVLHAPSTTCVDETREWDADFAQRIWHSNTTSPELQQAVGNTWRLWLLCSTGSIPSTAERSKHRGGGARLVQAKLGTSKSLSRARGTRSPTCSSPSSCATNCALWVCASHRPPSPTSSDFTHSKGTSGSSGTSSTTGTSNSGCQTGASRSSPSFTPCAAFIPAPWARCHGNAAKPGATDVAEWNTWESHWATLASREGWQSHLCVRQAAAQAWQAEHQEDDFFVKECGESEWNESCKIITLYIGNRPDSAAQNEPGAQMETDLACPSTCQVWGKAVTKDIGRPVLEWVETCWNGGIEDLAHFTKLSPVTDPS